MTKDDWWADRLRSITEWNAECDGPLIQRKNFDTFVRVEKVNSWDEWQNLLNVQFQNLEWLFRGHSRVDWRLETSLERAVVRHAEVIPGGPLIEHWMAHPHVLAEKYVLLTFQRRAHHYIPKLPAESEVMDWLALMQHHGVPTRLLDWTSSPYVALYFALEASSPDETCAVWAVDSSWVVETANSVLMKHDPKFPQVPDIRAFHQYLNEILLQQNPNVVVVVNPVRMNERAAAQQGMFLCDLGKSRRFDISLLDMIVSYPPKSPVVWKVEVTPDERVRFFHELGRMNISGESLFPGLDGFARSIRVRLQSDVDSRYEMVGWKIRKPQ
jgi:hypothetical protein